MGGGRSRLGRYLFQWPLRLTKGGWVWTLKTCAELNSWSLSCDGGAAGARLGLSYTPVFTNQNLFFSMDP